MEKRGAYVLLPLVMIISTVVWFAFLAERTGGVDQISTSPATATATGTARTALIVGDDFITGAGGVSAAPTYASQVCVALDWTCRIDAVRGTGYVAAGRDAAVGDESYPARLASDQSRTAPAVVVVTGGRADLGRDVARAAAGYFSALREAYPQARVVVVLPFTTAVDPPEKVQTLTQDVESAAQAAGVIVVPSDGLLTTADIGPDDVTPTVTGQQQLARRLAPRLAAATA